MMKTFCKHISKALLPLLIAFFAANSASATWVKMINEASQLKGYATLATDAGLPSDESQLIDNNPNTYWHTNFTDNRSTPENPHYLRVDLKSVYTGYIFVETVRRNAWAGWGAHPVAFDLYGSNDDANWTYIAYVSLPFDGVQGSTSVSNEIRIPGYRYLKFNLAATDGGADYTAIAEFQIYHDDVALDSRVGLGGYVTAMKDLSIEHTHGVLDSRNRTTATLQNWCDWSKWSADGRWSEADYVRNTYEVEMPDFSYLTNAKDSRIATGNRQPTHVIEHTLYALPGEPVMLYPVYGLNQLDQYKQCYIRWYDYKTDGSNSYLSLAVNPGSVIKTDNAGYFALTLNLFNKGTSGYVHFGDDNYSTIMYDNTVLIFTVDDYKNFVNMVNNGNNTLNAILCRDLDMNGVAVNPIGVDDNNPYKGTFDGCGHTISNLTIDNAALGYLGMFGRVGGGAVIKNISLRNAKMYGLVYVGGFVGGTHESAKVEEYRGTIVLENLHFSGYVGAAGLSGYGYTGGIIGANLADISSDSKSSGVYLRINNCVVDGRIGWDYRNDEACNGDWSFAIGYLGVNADVANCYNRADIYRAYGYSGVVWYFCYGRNMIWNATSNGSKISVTNCYDCNSNWYGEGFTIRAGRETHNSQDFISKLGNGVWRSTTLGYAVPTTYAPSHIWVGSDDFTGQNATFYAPEGSNFDEEYIAADFSQALKLSSNLDVNNKKFIEPAIVFRHIFNIKNGAKFAEEFSGSEANNKAYVKKNRRYVSARAGAFFQVRLDYPMPVEDGVKSQLYYKAAGGSYKSVYKYEVETCDANTGALLDSDLFYASEDAKGAGRTINGVTIGEEGKNFYRMLCCDADRAAVGRYLVKLYALDENGSRVKAYGSGADLQVAEFIISFVSDDKASFVPEADLANAKYAEHTEAYLQEKYGEPKAVVDFDEYRKLETYGTTSDATNGNNYIFPAEANTSIDPAYSPGNGYNARMYKWPVVWSTDTYGFGFDKRYDYSMYNVASHSRATKYHVAADENPAENNFGIKKGIYDRLFYNTEGKEYGYFYYTNAAADPGTMAKLDIDDLCTGSTLFVSAWVAEFSPDAETANVILNFNAILKDGSEVCLHSFTSGYVYRRGDKKLEDRLDENGNKYEIYEPTPEFNGVDNHGKWMHLYYSFVPNISEYGITSDDIDSYVLVVDNNCKNSGGADYAIDDIRVYLSKPEVYAEQLTPLCVGDTETRVKIDTEFEMLLSTFGLSEADSEESGGDITVYYTFLDKNKYNLSDGYETAFNAAALKNDDGTMYVGKLTFNTYYAGHDEYKGVLSGDNQAYRESVGGTRMLVFNSYLSDADLEPNKEYIIALYSDGELAGRDISLPGASEFNIEDQCAKRCTFTVHSAGVVKVNGVVVPDLDDITCCANQSPVVQITLQGKISTGEMVELPDYSYFDWFDGALSNGHDGFYEEEDKDAGKLQDVLATFRSIYPTADTWDMPVKGEEGYPGAGSDGKDYTENMRTYLHRLSIYQPDYEYGDLTGMRKLYLYQSSFTFQPVNVPKGAPEVELYVVAVPTTSETDTQVVIGGTTYDVKLCTSPAEVSIKVKNGGPEMLHGLDLSNTGAPYPEWMTDVPLRLGIEQLHKVSAAEKSVDNDTYTGSMLYIPVRMVNMFTTGVTKLVLKEDDPYVYLAETDDIDYHNLSNGSAYDEDFDDDIHVKYDLIPVGRIHGMVADLNGNAHTNYVKMAFYDNVSFREGCYYRLKFPYEEAGTSSSGGNVEYDQPPCDGEMVFTIKVVPKYVKWIGDESAINLNWNNDKNWTRVDSEEIYKKDTNTNTNEHLTDARNKMTAAFVPLDFTNVIIAANYDYPYLYSVETTPVEVTNFGTRQSKSWSYKTTVDSEFLNKIGIATDYIRFDMTSLDCGANGIGCRPWYDHTCNMIHFKQNAEIMAQQYLKYNTASVDIELDPARWYTLSSPLKSTYAGEMYLPKASGRQETELFQDITYSESLNNRFAPAVYQRAWNTAGVANVYKFGVTNPDNVAVATTWSNVYNDVKVLYGAGAGFSVKTDVSRLGSSKPSQVLFRLPKADTSYKYYTDATTPQSGHETAIDRTNRGRLNDTNGSVTVTAASASKYFLVGNPFMSHIDMKKFLSANSNVINSKYWIISGSKNIAVSIDQATGAVTSTDADETGMLPPMQGFFVEAKNAATSITLSYDESMICVAPYGSTPIVSRGMDDMQEGMLRITAMRGGEELTHAVIRIVPGSKTAYDESEDVAMLDDSNQADLPRVFSIAGNMVSGINTLPEIGTTEIGLMADDDENTVLVFDGTATVEGAVLYDSQTGRTTELYDGMEYTVTGAAIGHLFITMGLEEALVPEFVITASGHAVTVTAPEGCPEMTVNAYDVVGRQLYHTVDTNEQVTFTLPADGIYVIEAMGGGDVMRKKVQIR